MRAQSCFRAYILTLHRSQATNVSDELGKAIEELDAALKRLNIGVTAWAQIDGGADLNDVWWSRDIGYAKIGGKWGIALRTCSGDYSRPDDDDTEMWLFNDAPRWLLIEGIEHLPALIEKLIAETEATAEKIKTKVGEAKGLAEAISAINPPSSKK